VERVRREVLEAMTRAVQGASAMEVVGDDGESAERVAEEVTLGVKRHR